MSCCAAPFCAVSATGSTPGQADPLAALMAFRNREVATQSTAALHRAAREAAAVAATEARGSAHGVSEVASASFVDSVRDHVHEDVRGGKEAEEGEDDPQPGNVLPAH